jgi:hypothetical protein
MPMSTTDQGRTPAASLLWQDSQERQVLFPGGRGDWNSPTSAPASLLVAFALAVATVAFEWVLTSRTVASAEGLRITVRIVQTLLFGSGLLLLGVVTTRYVRARRAFFDRVHALRADQVARAVDELADGLPLAQLFRLNRRQLDEYHVLSVRQASTSFRNAAVAAAVAVAVLVVGAVVALQGAQTEASRYVVGGLAALGATLAAIVSRTFAVSYKETAEQLREYYREPARTARLLTLERLAADPSRENAVYVDLRKLLFKELLEDFRGHDGARAAPRARATRTEPGR